MGSHRWARPNGGGPDDQPHPDDECGSKALALVKYGRDGAREKCFWIDFTCVDQDNLAPGIAMLPLYTAMCDRFVFFESEEYHDRGWTRAERCIFATFNKPYCTALSRADDVQTSAVEEQEGQLARLMSLSGKHQRRRQMQLLQNPEEGLLTAEAADRPRLTKLVELAHDKWGSSWRGRGEDWAREGIQGLPELRFGETQVLVDRVMVRGSKRDLKPQQGASV